MYRIVSVDRLGAAEFMVYFDNYDQAHVKSPLPLSYAAMVRWEGSKLFCGHYLVVDFAKGVWR